MIRRARRAASLAIALCAIAALVGCSTVGGLYDRWFGSQPAVKPAPLPPLTASVQSRIAWRGEVGAAEKSVFFPAASGNLVYAAGAAGQIVGFDARSGTPKVRLNAGERLNAGVAASASLIVVGTAKGEVL